MTGSKELEQWLIGYQGPRGTRHKIAEDAHLSDSHLYRIQQGKRNPNPTTLQRLTESMGIPLADRAKIFFQATEYNNEEIQALLHPPHGIQLSATPDTPTSFGELLDIYIPASLYGGNNNQVAKAIGTKQSTVSRWRNNERYICEWRNGQSPAARAKPLVRVLGVPMERMAEILLLAHGHSYDVVHQILVAAGANYVPITENPTSRTFQTEDSLLTVVKNRLLFVKPDEIEKIRTLFGRSLNDARDDIVAVQANDILTVVDALLYRRMEAVTPSTGRAIRAARPSWQYLAPISRNRQTTRTFQEEIFDAVNPADVAFATAFEKNVVPVLSPDWLEKAKGVFESQYGVRLTGMQQENQVVFESFTHGLLSTLRNRQEDASHFIEIVRSSLNKDIDEAEVLQFLFQAAQEREGVLIGFNSVAMTHKRGYNTDLLGYVDLTPNPIVAIEALGEHEDRVLEELGLT